MLNTTAHTETSTKPTELIERYLYAVTRHLPLTEREEVNAELDSLIAEMLDERCGAVVPTEKDVRVVLTELGSPQEVAMQYSGEPDRALISGVYYLTYKRILKIVLPIVAIAIPAAVLLSLLDEGTLASFTAHPPLFVAQLLGQIIGGAVGGVFQAFAIITLIFALIERTRVDITDLSEGLDEGATDLLSQLPQVPEKSEQIKPWEPVLGIFFSVLFAVFLLALPQIAGGYFEGVGWIPIFQTAAIRSLYVPIVLWVILGIIKEIVRLIEGRHTWLVALVTIVTNILIFGCLLLIVFRADLLNPAFLSQMRTVLQPEEGGALVMTVLRSVNLLFGALVLFGLVVDSITAVAKAIRYESGRLSETIASWR